jgi:hypothetical protein
MVENLFDKTARNSHNQEYVHQKLALFHPDFVLNNLDNRVTLEFTS